MCGISGFFSIDMRDRSGQLSAINEALHHRGPDDGGLWFSRDGSVGLGHRRLSIIDLSATGRQPMVSGSKRFTTVFNGEIYNFQELKNELIRLGYGFRGTSDTEVMLACFEEWGIAGSLKKLNGMFSAAVWDEHEAALYIFRDRLGVKPLYYRWCADALYFSSELTKPFARLGEREIDRRALAFYCRYNYVPAPMTIYKGIFKLTPGTLCAVTRQSAAGSRFKYCQAYWDAPGEADKIIASRDNSMDMEEAVEILEAELGRSLKQRMISDVPLGAFLSGGIDSSLIVAHMQKAGSAPVRTFTIGFPEVSCDESDYALKVAEYLGTEHRGLMVTEKDALDIIPRISSIYGEPFADPSQIPVFLLSELTRRHITVALSGDGGDELFAGYKSYLRLAQMEKYLSFVPPSFYAAAGRTLRSALLARAASGLLGDQYYEWLFNALRLFARKREKYINAGNYASSSVSEKMVLGAEPGASVMPFYRCNGNIVEQKMLDDLKMYLPDGILTKVDRASMAVSLEVRSPFSDDFHLLQTAWKIPFHLKLNKDGGKMVLKKALSRHLPPALFQRRKMGFSVPLKKWVDGPLKDWVYSSLDLSRVKQEGYLDARVLKNILAADRNDWRAYKLWALCIFENWLKHFHLSAEN